MNNILEFLRQTFETPQDNLDTFDVSADEMKKVNKLLNSGQGKSNVKGRLRLRPRLQKNQIWTIKHEYIDFLGIQQKSSHPFVVLIIKDPDDIAEESFVRVNVISPFVELSSFNDIVIKDSSIIGFPFLIEVWNEQPVLAEILEEYLGYFESPTEINKISALENNPTEEEYFSLKSYQREFQEIEISKAQYLNNSVRALLTFLEQRQSEDSGVVISIFDRPEFPAFYIGNNPKGSDYALAAKSGIDTEDKFIKYTSSEVPLEIFVRKNEDGFVISVLPGSNIQLFMSDKTEIVGVSTSEKSVFSNLKPGLYILIASDKQKPIKIRIK